MAREGRLLDQLAGAMKGVPSQVGVCFLSNTGSIASEHCHCGRRMVSVPAEAF